MCGVWIASWADDEQYKEKNSLARRSVLVLVWREGELDNLPLLRWWLVLFIEALVLFPNIEREGIPQWRDLKGDT